MSESCASNDLVKNKMAWLFWYLPSALIIVGGVWHAAIAWLWPPSLFVAGFGCVVNAARCHRLHCYVTGPLFLLGSAASLLQGLEIVSWGWNLIGNGLLVGVLLAFLPEWLLRRKYLKKA
ncbi:MAG: hypothetical protein ACE5HO_15860 [bacterium]